MKKMSTTHKSTLDLAIIGNCSNAALIDKQGCIVWACLPHIDGDPVFSALVNDFKGAEEDWGFWDFDLVDLDKSEQFYIENTAVLVTRLYDTHGNAVQITDCAPRYARYGRFFRDPMICRIVEPLRGKPRIKMRLRPRFDWGMTAPMTTRGGSNIRFVSPNLTLRLTTDAPVRYICDETPFRLDRKLTFIFGLDEPVQENIERVGLRYLENTIRYWRDFVRGLALPYEWQDALIRSAITLKMCTFEETGAIVAALTTSIPEAPGSERNWDYRYCWMRDSLFVINALNRLNTTKAMEDYMRFIMNVALKEGDDDIQPFYGIGLQDTLTEEQSDVLKGYRGMGPVRTGNAAYDQKQHDVWGSVILALSQAFFDKRLHYPGTVEDFQTLEKFGESAFANFDKPDAGIWEFRTIGRVHTFSAVMCWVACDRLSRIAAQLGLGDRAGYWREKADHIHAVIMKRAWSPKKNSFVEPFDGDHLDASLLLLHEVGFISAKDPKFIGTVEAIEKDLVHEGLLYRYTIEDDFGAPEVAFTVCTFWYIDALAAIGRTQEARDKFELMLSRRNHVGILSEDMEFKTHELWGNFPQTYSMVGMINSAMRLSKLWHEAI